MQKITDLVDAALLGYYFTAVKLTNKLTLHDDGSVRRDWHGDVTSEWGQLADSEQVVERTIRDYGYLGSLESGRSPSSESSGPRMNVDIAAAQATMSAALKAHRERVEFWIHFAKVTLMSLMVASVLVGLFFAPYLSPALQALFVSGTTFMGMQFLLGFGIVITAAYAWHQSETRRQMIEAGYFVAQRRMRARSGLRFPIWCFRLPWPRLGH
jgi:hypothetical protein